MDILAKKLLVAASVLSCFNIYPVLAAPSRVDYYGALQNSSQQPADLNWAGGKRQSKVPLRILSLGASIMSGTGSTTLAGSRKPLRNYLRQDGYEVNMVGSLHSGAMVDNNHDAVPGDVLSQVLARVPNATPYKPNIVIINVGTNDGLGSIDIAGTGDRMNNILNALWNAADMSNTCIMVSTVLPTTSAIGTTNRVTTNKNYRDLVSKRAAEGKCIYLADIDFSDGTQWLDFDTDYDPSESVHIHPNDQGHAKLAATFLEAIYNALNAGRVVAAAPFSTGSSVCDKFAGSGIDAGGLTQRGSGYHDGIYYHGSVEMGIVTTIESSWDRNQFKFARLYRSGYDDLVAWIDRADSFGIQTFAVWANSADGKGKFTAINNFSPDLLCNDAAGVNFIDMNGDGLDDLVYIDSAGNAYLSINQGDGDRSANKPPTFKRVSDTAMIKTNEGYGRDNVRLADIDGDGRGDYGVIDASGNVYFWRNGWINDIPEYWQSMGLRFTGKNMGDIRGTRFEDINGDGRDDWVWLSDVGVGTIYTNARSCLDGQEGNGLNVAWRQGFLAGESSGPAYKGMGGFVTSTETYLRDRIHFGRVFGGSDVFGNLPRQDYIFMQHTLLASGKHSFAIRVWRTVGGGGTKLLADGNKYCNMKGHANGMVDYVWTWSTGAMEVWANRGKGTITDSDPDGYWSYEGTMWTPPGNMNRRDLHLADWDGDGACDVIYTDPSSGAVQVWINNYPKTGTWTWTYKSNPAPTLSCFQTRGLGIYDLPVRFADLTGNGRADYLCIEPDGRVSGAVHNNDDSFELINQIKFSEAKDRANLRWADVNGDGLDDMIWIEKFSGDSYVWYNSGRGNPADTSGSSFVWRKQTAVAYAGLSAGTCIFYADLDGNGIADEHNILGTFTNQARTSRAPSCGHSDVTGDDPVASTLDITRYIQTLSSNAGSGLGGHATCNDMPNNGASVVAADYAAVGAAGVLKSWRSTWAGGDNGAFCGDFATTWGISKEFKIGATNLEHVTCSDLVGRANADSAAALLIINSCVNLNNYLNYQYNTFNGAYSLFSAMDIAIEEDFYPATDGNALREKQLLYGVEWMITSAGSVITGPAASILAGATNAIISGFMTTISDSDHSLKDIAKSQTSFNDFAKNILEGISGVGKAMLSAGVDTNTNHQTDELFSAGQWADTRQVPLLSDTVTNSMTIVELTEYYQAVLLAMATNAAWKQQNVWIACRPMSEDDLNTQYTVAGDNNPKLRAYYAPKGLGCYLQRVHTGTYLSTDYVDSPNPEGWDLLGTSKYPYSLNDVIQSSLSAYFTNDKGIFNFTITDATTQLSNLVEAGGNMGKRLYTFPGLFNLPVWVLSDNAVNDCSLDYFLRIMLTPASNLDQGYPTSFCYAEPDVAVADQSVEPDVNGKYLKDVLNNRPSPTHYCRWSAYDPPYVWCRGDDCVPGLT